MQDRLILTFQSLNEIKVGSLHYLEEDKRNVIIETCEPMGFDGFVLTATLP